MSFGAKTPKVPPAPSYAPISNVAESVSKSRDDARKKAIQAFGFPSTTATGAFGVSSQANTSTKSLLGQ